MITTTSCPQSVTLLTMNCKTLLLDTLAKGRPKRNQFQTIDAETEAMKKTWGILSKLARDTSANRRPLLHPYTSRHMRNK